MNLQWQKRDILNITWSHNIDEFLYDYFLEVAVTPPDAAKGSSSGWNYIIHEQRGITGDGEILLYLRFHNRASFSGTTLSRTE